MNKLLCRLLNREWQRALTISYLIPIAYKKVCDEKFCNPLIKNPHVAGFYRNIVIVAENTSASFWFVHPV